MFWLKSTTTGIGQKCHLTQAVFSACLLSRDSRNARIKWYRFRLSSRHCTFKTVVKCIYLARKKWGWKSERCHVRTSNWEIRCGLYTSLLLWSETLTFSFPLPPSIFQPALLRRTMKMHHSVFFQDVTAIWWSNWPQRAIQPFPSEIQKIFFLLLETDRRH